MLFKFVSQTQPHLQDLPGELFGFNAGFSCKSFSKLHPDWQAMKRAMQDDNNEP